MAPGEFRDRFRQLISIVERRVMEKAAAVELSVICLLARGHLLFEDVPGVGKTTLARGLSDAIGGHWRRIQGTADLLPSDITGTSVIRPPESKFVPLFGPIFANVVIFDEINRTAPRTQSALLEAMQERQVSLVGQSQTYRLAEPFLVIATQNPIEMAGTYPLPEAQLDRFLMRLRLGGFDEAAECAFLRRMGPVAPGQEPTGVGAPGLGPGVIRTMQDAALAVPVRDNVLTYLVRLMNELRDHPHVALGPSPRASLALLQAAKVRALTRADAGEVVVRPDDIQFLAPHVLAHRLGLRASDTDEYLNPATLSQRQRDLVVAALRTPSPKRP